MKRLTFLIAFSGLLTLQTALADVRLPNVFGTHMVLQRRKPVPIWGWADSGENVTVTVNNLIKKTKTGKDGKWQVILDPMEAGGPFQLIVKGKNNVTFDDVLIGEVWVCSGQSNMEWPLSAASNAKTEIPEANFPVIRQLLVKKDVSLTPKDNIDGKWSVCTPETAPTFTAVGYFFAKQLQQELNVPIGLINTSWGGTHSETWTSREAMLRDPELSPMVVYLPSSFSTTAQELTGYLKLLVQEKQGGILPTVAEEKTWADADFNDKQWLSMNLPQNWDFQGGLPNFDGVVWFRREVILSKEANPKHVILSLGTIDDTDSTFVNGQFVGLSNNYDISRHYNLADGILKPGRNVIAVRVKDTGSLGGFTGEREDMNLSIDGVNLLLDGEWRYRIAHVQKPAAGSGPNAYGTLLFNAMLNPLIPYAIAGALWYQGESNAGRAFQYRKSFPLMIQDWRQRWGYDFPFLFVQLASFNAANGDSRHGSTWAELREAQTLTLKLPNTGMAVTSDIGERSDIHPKNKQDVGKRLVAEALRVAYPEKGAATNNVSQGPMFENMTVTGNQVAVTFKNIGQGLWVKDKYGYVKGFEVAGADQKFYYAKAEIQGNAVTVHADSVATPVAIRYGWADDNGDVNLYNQQGFPAVPFRTDTWKGITEAVKFGDQ